MIINTNLPFKSILGSTCKSPTTSRKKENKTHSTGIERQEKILRYKDF